MAKGEVCSQCGYYMFALEEKENLKGIWVVYECRNERCKHHMKVFEDKVTLINFHEVSHKSLGI